MEKKMKKDSILMKNDENKPRKVQCLQKKLGQEKIYVHRKHRMENLLN